MHLILLSGENLKLARLESESLLKLEYTDLKDNKLFCTIPTDNLKIMDRLAYARKIYEIMYVTERKNLEASLKTYPWINYYDKNFCLRVTSDEHYDERYYAGFVWQSLERSTRPKVNLDNPNLLIEVFIEGNKAVVARLLYHNFEMFEDRKAHLKPVLHPTAMHPKMARALVNILNPGPREKIIDPFCGACGILTEAGLLGLQFEGYDINSKILEDAGKNMEYYDIDPKKYVLKVKDSTTLKSLKNVVTDLPYGKSSRKSHDLIELYSRFLKKLSGRAVIVMPNFMPYKALLDKNLPKSLIVTNIIDQYVHKSLTRKIIVIDNKNHHRKTDSSMKHKKKDSTKKTSKHDKRIEVRKKHQKSTHKVKSIHKAENKKKNKKHIKKLQVKKGNKKLKNRVNKKRIIKKQTTKKPIKSSKNSRNNISKAKKNLNKNKNKNIKKKR